MLHRITGRAGKCGPCAISAIAGVPTHEAAAVIRRLFDRRTVNGVFIDELAAALAVFGWAPDCAIGIRTTASAASRAASANGSAFSPASPPVSAP